MAPDTEPSTDEYHKLGHTVVLSVVHVDMLYSLFVNRYQCRAARPGRRDADAAASCAARQRCAPHERSVAAVNARHTITATIE